MISTEKSAHDVGELKRLWLAEPNFDLARTKGFEAHRAELEKYVREHGARLSQRQRKTHLVHRDLEVRIPAAHRFGERTPDGMNYYEFVEAEAEKLEERSRYGGGMVVDGDQYEIAVRMHVNAAEVYITVLDEHGLPYADNGLARPLR